MNFQKNSVNFFSFVFLYLALFCLNIEFAFAQSGSDAPEMEKFEAEVDPNPPPEKSQDEIKSMFAPLRITLDMDMDLGLEEYQSRGEALKEVKVYSSQWVSYVEQHNKDLLEAQKKKYLLDKEYRKNRIETVAAYKEEHKYMVEEKKYTEEISAQKNVKKDVKKDENKSKTAKKREAEDLKVKKKYAADPEKLKEKQDELQLKRDAENEKKKEKDGFSLEKYKQRKKNNPLLVQEKIDNLDKSFDKVVDSLDNQYQRKSQEINEQITQLEAENSEEMKRFKEIQELDYDIRLSIGLATKGIGKIHNQNAKKVAQMLDDLTVSKFYNEETGEIVNQPFLDELVENIFYTNRKIDVESVSISRLISNYEEYNIEGKQGAVGFRVNLDKDYVLMLLHLQIDGKKALLFKKTDIKEDNDLVKEQEIITREEIKAEYEQWLEKRNQQHSEQIEQLTVEYDDITSDLFEEKNSEILFKKVTNYILLRRQVNNRHKVIQADNASEENIEKINLLFHSIAESMTYATEQINKIENERQKDINRTLSDISKRLEGTNTSDIYDVETGKFTDLEFIKILKENMFFSAVPLNIESSMISRIVPNPKKWGINPLSPATGYRINLDNEYDLLILKLENGEVKAVMLKRQELPVPSTIERNALNIELAQNAEKNTAEEQAIEQNLRELNQVLSNLELSEIYDTETEKFTDTEFIEKLKANIFYSRTETNISTSGIGRIVPNSQKHGMNPKMAAKGYRFNIDADYDLLVVKLENKQVKAIVLKRNELPVLSTSERDKLHLHLAKTAQAHDQREQVIGENLQDLNQRLANLVLSEIYDTETGKFIDTEFIEKLKANIFYSQTKENIHTSGVGRIVPNVSKYGMNPKMAAKGYRFNIDSKYDLLILKLENNHIQALIHQRNELEQSSTLERDKLHLHLAKKAQAHDQREQVIEENLQDLNQRLANLKLSEIYDTETDKFTDTEFIEKLKANIFYSQTKENIHTSGVGRIVPNVSKYGMNPKMAAKGYRFNIDPKYDLLILKLENNHIQALIHQRNELEQSSTLERDELHLHLAKKAQAKTEGEQAIEQNLQEISKKFRELQLTDIYNQETDEFTDTEFIEKLKANIFYSQAKENIHTSGVGRIVPNASKYGMNPKMAAKGYRFNIDPKHDLMVLKLENHKIYAIIHQRNELEEKQYPESISYWNIDEHYLAQRQDSSNRAFLIEAKGIHQSLKIDKSDSLDLDKFETKINDLSLLQHRLKKKITENNQSAWAMPSVKPLDSLRNVIYKQVSKASKELSALQNQRTHRAETYLNAKFDLAKIYDEEKKEFVDLDYLKEFGNSVFYSKKSPSIETTGLGKVIPDVAYYGVNPKIRAIGHRININPNYDLIIIKLATGTKHAIIWNKITFKTLDAWNLNL